MLYSVQPPSLPQVIEHNDTRVTGQLAQHWVHQEHWVSSLNPRGEGLSPVPSA